LRCYEKKCRKCIEHQIKRDIPRQFHSHPVYGSPDSENLTKGQKCLYHVQKALALHDPKLGYVPGLAPIVALLLLYMSETTTFWMLERMIYGHKYKLLGFYQQNVPLGAKYVYIHQNLFKRYNLRLFSHFETQGVKGSDYAAKWFVALFSDFPVDLAGRIFDIFLYEGSVFLFRVCLSLLSRFESTLLTMKLSEIILFLTSLPHHRELNQTDAIINNALSIKITKQEIEKHSKDYDRQNLGLSSKDVDVWSENALGENLCFSD